MPRESRPWPDAPKQWSRWRHPEHGICHVVTNQTTTARDVQLCSDRRLDVTGSPAPVAKIHPDDWPGAWTPVREEQR